MKQVLEKLKLRCTCQHTFHEYDTSAVYVIKC